jgi:hypothetical protein
MGDPLSLRSRVSEVGIEFVTLGGYVGIVHGCGYLTQDVDICCVFATDSLLALQKVWSRCSSGPSHDARSQARPGNGGGASHATARLDPRHSDPNEQVGGRGCDLEVHGWF